MADGQDYRGLATGLADMARVLLEQETVQDTLDSIVEHARTLVNGCDGAGILVVHRGEMSTLAATDSRSRESDLAQGAVGEGPCFDATVERQRVYRIEDLHEAESRWPRYARRARELGIGSIMGFLLYTNGRDNLGALDLYSTRRDAFGEEAEHVGWVLASHAAVALSAARHAENLDIALSTSRLIGEAIGIVMSRYKIAEHEAFDRMRAASQRGNVKIRRLAETVLEIGELPT